MAFYRPHGVALAAALVLSAGGAAGQGIPVIDQTAILKHIESIAQLKSQLDALHQQIEQAQQLYGSLNKLTDMADVANVLNDPAIRKALPSDFAAIEGLLKGEGSGVFKDSASKFLEGNSTYRTDADDFYAKELARVQNKNAGQMSLGQQMYDAATKRIDGIDQLRQQRIVGRQSEIIHIHFVRMALTASRPDRDMQSLLGLSPGRDGRLGLHLITRINHRINGLQT